MMNLKPPVYMLLLALALTFAASGRNSRAETPPPAAAPAPTVPAPTPTPVPAESDDSARQYCRGIANAAADARFIRQKEALAAAEKDIEVRLAQLEKKRAEYQDWLERRETFLKK